MATSLAGAAPSGAVVLNVGAQPAATPIGASFTGHFRSGSWTAAKGQHRIRIYVACSVGQRVEVGLYREWKGNDHLIPSMGVLTCNNSGFFKWNTNPGRFHFELTTNYTDGYVDFNGHLHHP